MLRLLLGCCAVALLTCAAGRCCSVTAARCGAVQTEVRRSCASVPCIRRAAYLTRALCMQHAGAGWARWLPGRRFRTRGAAADGPPLQKLKCVALCILAVRTPRCTPHSCSLRAACRGRAGAPWKGRRCGRAAATAGPPLRQSQDAMATTRGTAIGAHGAAGCALPLYKFTALSGAPLSRLATCAMLCTARCGALLPHVLPCSSLRVALYARAVLLLRLRAAALLWLLGCCAVALLTCAAAAAALLALMLLSCALWCGAD